MCDGIVNETLFHYVCATFVVIDDLLGRHWMLELNDFTDSMDYTFVYFC